MLGIKTLTQNTYLPMESTRKLLTGIVSVTETKANTTNLTRPI